MARLYGIKKRLAEQNLDENLAKEIIGNGNLVDIITRMEKLLDPEITYEILDSCSCGIGQKELKSIKKIQGDTLEQCIKNIKQLDDFHSQWDVILNEDNHTITAGWTLKDHESHDNVCVCTAAVNKTTKVNDLVNKDITMPLTYCFCCAGHCRRHLERLLDIKLKTVKIQSSPINSKGQKPCEFMFEIKN